MAEAKEALGFDPDALREKYREERDKRLADQERLIETLVHRR